MERRPPVALLIRLSPLLAALVAACDKPPVDTYQGYVEGEYVSLAASQAGRLEQLSVQRGQTVQANAPLFAVQAERETAALAQAQQQLNAARALLADMQTGKRLPEIAVIKAQLAQAAADARKAALQLERDEAQYRGGGISRGQRDDSRENAAATAARESELRHQVAVAQMPTRNEQVASQKAQVESAAAALRLATWNLSQTQVNAPADGLVTDTLYRPGEWVAAGNPVVQLLPPQNVKLRFFVPQSALASFAPGQTLKVRCDGCDSGMAASVTYLSNTAEYTPPVIYSNESRSRLVFMVEARPDDAALARLHPGQPVEVTKP